MIGKNNPFNIRNNHRNKWIGQVGSNRGFCNFITLEYGVRAACYLLLKSYRKRSICTLSDIVYSFAPPFENDSDAYILYLHDHGCPDICNTLGDYVVLLSHMSVYEGNPVSSDLILKVINRFELWK